MLWDTHWPLLVAELLLTWCMNLGNVSKHHKRVFINMLIYMYSFFAGGEMLENSVSVRLALAAVRVLP